MDIRPFDHTLRDARGIIDVDRATFNDCHYAPEYIIELASADQYIWVADDSHGVVGFVSAFGTRSLAGPRWEIDELAVHPSAQGRGIGTALVAAAVQNAPLPARAIVARGNIASQRAFVKNGFAPAADAHLLVWDTSRAVFSRAEIAISVRRAQSADVLAPEYLLQETENACLIGERDGIAQGHIELVRVRTLQYEGYWIESIMAQEPKVARELLRAAIDLSQKDGKIDLLGCLAPAQSIAYEACTDLGLELVNQYTIFGKTQE
ncbi:MAG: GNAT family N-acetyltransferase [Anaerolineae bacterium]|nr:GNAT family N-acetyltransferase [Anaerolineae bacterium]